MEAVAQRILRVTAREWGVEDELDWKDRAEQGWS